MPTYKLTYFNVRGFGELARLTLVAAGQKFEDVRVAGEQWKELKPKTPQGKLPILEFDGKTIPQSGAIVRYVAKTHGLYSENIMEATDIEVVLETINDFVKDRIKAMFEKDEAAKEKLIATFNEETMPFYLGLFEKMLGKNDWLVGSKFSVADIAIFNAFEAIAKDMEKKKVDIYAKYPGMKKHADRVGSIEPIKKWVSTRPVTDM